MPAAYTGARRDSVRANRPSGSVSQRDQLETGRREVALQALGRELGADLGAQLLAGVEVDRAGRARRIVLVSSRRARRRISIHSCSGSKSATWSKSSGSKSASSSRLSTRSTLRLNSAVTPCGVVVGRLEDARVLDQVGAHQQVVARGRAGARSRAGSAAGCRAGSCRSCRRGRRRAAGRRRRRHPVEMALEVADHAVDAQPRVLAGQLLGAVAHHALGHVDRHVALAACRRRAARRAARASWRRCPSRARPARRRPSARRAPRRRARGSRARRASGSTRAARRSGRTAPRRARRRSAWAAAP